MIPTIAAKVPHSYAQPPPPLSMVRPIEQILETVLCSVANTERELGPLVKYALCSFVFTKKLLRDYITIALV